MRRVLCVCIGNTCRSPLMEGILRHELAELGVTDVTVESAGLDKKAEGQPIAEHSCTELQVRGIDLSGHRSRHIESIGDLNNFDLILCVTEEVATAVKNLNAEVAGKTVIFNEDGGGIPNPWKLGAETYRECASVVERVMRGVARALRDHP